jgi:hypothetical protein
MNRDKTTDEMLGRCLRGGPGALILALLLISCSTPTTSTPTPTPPPFTPTPTLTLTPTATPIPIPTLTPLPLRPTATPQPVTTPTPVPNEQEIVDAVLGMRGVAHRVDGSFTAPEADELLALVGGIGDRDEARWVIIGQTDDVWRLRGTSELLATGFSDPPPGYFPPELLDFNNDGQQEALIHYFKMQDGWMTSSDTLYRWDGHALAPIWSVPTVVDNTSADVEDVPQPYKENYQAEWEWSDLDDDGVDEILLSEEVIFHPADEPRGLEGEKLAVLGEEAWKRAFRWDGETFRPYAAEGPDHPFAYTAGDDLWLWKNRTSHPLAAEGVAEFQWSPDGRYLAWWVQPSFPEVASQSAALGVEDLGLGIRREFSLEDVPSALRWAPDGRLTYILPGQPPTLLDPETGQQEALPATDLGSWSPDGSLVAHVREGSLYAYDPSVRQERPLIAKPGGAAEDAPEISHPAWSPRGDWIACILEVYGLAYLGIVSPDVSEPVQGPDALETFNGGESTELQFAWSPDGSHLAALTTDARLQRRPTALFLGEVPAGGEAPTGRFRWRQVLQVDAVAHTGRLSWSPDSERVGVAIDQDIWEVTAAGEATLRHHFSVPELSWTALEWATDGSGWLAGLAGGGVGYRGRLYWFPADGSEPMLLLADSPGTARWSPQTVEVVTSPWDRIPMALAEYEDTEPLLHFTNKKGFAVVVLAEGADHATEFQVAGQRVYYEGRYADRSGVVSLPIPDVPGHLHGVRATSDGSQLAWLFVDDRTAEAHFRLVVSDGRGNDPGEVWHHVETPTDFRWINLLSWRSDGRVIYLTDAATDLEPGPGLLALDILTGRATRLSDLQEAANAAVSPDGAWLVQAEMDLEGGSSLTITLRSLVKKKEIHIAGVEGAYLADDFSFAPDSSWLAWREWASIPKGAKLLVRVLPLPAGEPFMVHEEPLNHAPTVIGGWAGKDALVLIHEDGAGPSTGIPLPSGPASPLSPFVFLGALD